MHCIIFLYFIVIIWKVSPGSIKFIPTICSDYAKINCISDLDSMIVFKLFEVLGNADSNKSDVFGSKKDYKDRGATSEIVGGYSATGVVKVAKL